MIRAQRKELGLARLSERTLKNRQHEAYRLILHWAESETLATVPQFDLPFNRRKQQLRRASVAGGIVILLTLAVWGLTHLSHSRGSANSSLAETDLKEQLRRVDARYIGVPLQLESSVKPGIPPLKELLPAAHFPLLAARLGYMMLLPGAAGADPRVLLSTRRGGPEGGRVWLWDADADSFVWKLDWHPPREEIFTHSTLDTTVYDQAWGISSMIWRTGKLDLGTRLALCYRQLYSPCFILIVDRESGKPLAHYAHPGHLFQPYLADLSGDGTPEILCAGTDNALNRPVLTVLEADMRDGAASTCMWNEKGEGALFRVLLPAVRPLEKLFEDPRLGVRPIENADWSAETGLLSLEICGGQGTKERAYFAHLYHGCEVHPGHGLNVGDPDIYAWTKCGLDFANLEPQLESQIELVRGPEFEKIMGEIVPQLAHAH